MVNYPIYNEQLVACTKDVTYGHGNFAEIFRHGEKAGVGVRLSERGREFIVIRLASSILGKFSKFKRAPEYPGSQGVRGGPFSEHRSSGTAAILLELSCKVCRNEHPAPRAVRLHPVYRKSRERLFNWTRSTIIEERCSGTGKKSLDIPLLAALLIPRPSDTAIFYDLFCGEEESSLLTA